MTERPPGDARGRRLALAALAVGVLLSAGGVALMQATGVVDLRRSFWLAGIVLFGPEEVGIWEPDPQLGWRHEPGAVGRHRDVPYFDVTYHIDGEGHRRVPGSDVIEGPEVLFLGGSFTFGHGVEDDETYPALLQQAWPDLRVVNAAANAWGPTQAYWVLRDALATDPDIALVVYGFITHHLTRSHRSAAWLQSLDQTKGRRNPYFEVDDGELVFRGLADPRDGLPDDRAQLQREVRVTTRLLIEMARACEAHDVPFVVVHLPDGVRGRALNVLVSAVGADRVVDLESELDYARLRFPHDPHPTPAGHREIARVLRPELERRMGRVP